VKLLSVNQDGKTRKGLRLGVLTGIMYMSPAAESGVANVCRFSTPGCEAGCLNKGGRLAMPVGQAAQMERTRLLFKEPGVFWPKLMGEIEALIRKARREGLRPAVRLNGTSDLPWERMKLQRYQSGKSIMNLFPEVQFYDYTKYPYRSRPVEGLPSNYDLTYSFNERDGWDAAEVNLWSGRRVAVVYSTRKGQPLPESYTPRGYDPDYNPTATVYGGRLGDRSKPGFTEKIDVVDGDLTDCRFIDPLGVIVGLRAKGKARRDESGFVVQVG
jgi:hypothetical protein